MNEKEERRIGRKEGKKKRKKERKEERKKEKKEKIFTKMEDEKLGSVERKTTLD